MGSDSQMGKITVAPEVLETIARLTALAVPGVARLVPPPGVQRILGQSGVRLEVVEDRVKVDLYVVADPGTNLLNLGHQIQTEVARAIRDLVGMQVRQVDVHIEDITYPTRID